MKLSAKQVRAMKVAMILQGADQVTNRSRLGFFEVREIFFYRHGRTAQKYGERFAKFGEVIGTGEAWNRWPRDSYFFARIEPTEGGVAMAEFLAQAEADSCGISVEALYKDLIEARS